MRADGLMVYLSVYTKSNSENYSLVDCNVTKIYPIEKEKKVIKCFVVTYFLLH